MGWVADVAEALGKLPARFLALTVGLAAGAFVLVVVTTLISYFWLDKPLVIAGYEFGSKGVVIFAAPPDAVVAFANTVSINEPKKQCPQGWSPFEPARGRMIVGAGVSNNTDYNHWDRAGSGTPVALTPHEPLKPGGEENHVLVVPELPPHDHGLATLSGIQVAGASQPFLAAIQKNTTNGSFGGRTELVGHGDPFNLMPPFVALYYCKKD